MQVLCGLQVLFLLFNCQTPVARELEFPAYRNIGLAWKEKKGTSPMLRRFMEYLEYR